MDFINEVFGEIMQASADRVQKNDGDYLKDGLLYCGKCHTKKQTRVMILDQEYTPYCLCQCEIKQREKDEAEQRLLAKEQEKQYRLQKLKSFSMMTDKLRSSTFSEWQGNQKIKKICTNYVNTFSDRLQKNQGLLLYGSSGLGKTFASACIANALLEQGFSVVMTSFIRFVNFSQFSDDTQDLLRYMNEVDLLILDDLGAERTSDYAIEKVNAIIDSRSLQNKPLIVSTNLTLQDMKNAKDIRYERIYQRILEMCYPVYFTGESYRISKAKDNFEELKKILTGD